MRPDGLEPRRPPRASATSGRCTSSPAASRSWSRAIPTTSSRCSRPAPHDAPSLTGESPLRPILGPNSVLTSVGERHMRQRKLLLPPFHGEAVQRYVADDLRPSPSARSTAGRSVQPFALAPRMQAVTLDVIMGGVFGISGKPPRGTPEHRLRETIRRMLLASTQAALPADRAPERRPPRAAGHPPGACSALARPADLRRDPRASRARRGRRTAHDVLSLLLQARDEDGQRAHRRRAPRRAADARARRPRDDRELARVDVRAAAAHTRALTTGCASWSRGDDAGAPRTTSRRRSTRACASARSSR